jgi:hypothetical protein
MPKRTLALISATLIFALCTVSAFATRIVAPVRVPSMAGQSAVIAGASLTGSAPNVSLNSMRSLGLPALSLTQPALQAPQSHATSLTPQAPALSATALIGPPKVRAASLNSFQPQAAKGVAPAKNFAQRKMAVAAETAKVIAPIKAVPTTADRNLRQLYDNGTMSGNQSAVRGAFSHSGQRNALGVSGPRLYSKDQRPSADFEPAAPAEPKDWKGRLWATAKSLLAVGGGTFVGYKAADLLYTLDGFVGVSLRTIGWPALLAVVAAGVAGSWWLRRKGARTGNKPLFWSFALAAVVFNAGGQLLWDVFPSMGFAGLGVGLLGAVAVLLATLGFQSKSN